MDRSWQVANNSCSSACTLVNFQLHNCTTVQSVFDRREQLGLHMTQGDNSPYAPVHLSSFHFLFSVLRLHFLCVRSDCSAILMHALSAEWRDPRVHCWSSQGRNTILLCQRRPLSLTGEEAMVYSESVLRSRGYLVLLQN